MSLREVEPRDAYVLRRCPLANRGAELRGRGLANEMYTVHWNPLHKRELRRHRSKISTPEIGEEA